MLLLSLRWVRLKLPKLKGIRLFDVFESDKLGVNKKSMALSFTFVDEEKTHDRHRN